MEKIEKTMTFSIHSKELHKQYLPNLPAAIDGVSLTVSQSSIFGILGSNGAGKTTLLRLLAGDITPTEGQISLNGYELIAQPTHHKALEQVQALFETDSPSGSDIPIQQILVNVPGSEDEADEAKAKQLLGELDLWDQRNLPPSALSFGAQRRFLLAKTILSKASILLLDEPLVGLDENMGQVVKMWLRKQAKYKTIVLATRYPEVIKGLCDHVAVLNRGRLIKSQPIHEMSGFFKEFYQIQVKGHLSPQWQQRFDNLFIKSQEDGVTTMIGHVTDQAALHSIIIGMRDLGLPLLSITRIEPNLSNILDCLMRAEYADVSF